MHVVIYRAENMPPKKQIDLSQRPTKLEDCTEANTPPWNFNGLNVDAKVIAVYDGDTITVAFGTPPLGIFSHKIRLLGIDTPELKTDNPKEKEAAIVARDYLRSLVLGKIVKVCIKENDKYGRLIGDVLLDGENISAKMLAGKYGVPYDGGKKAVFGSAEHDQLIAANE